MGAFVSWEDDHGWDGGYDGAAQAYRMLLRLLKEAEETTDILGNHSAPDDSMSVDFGKVVEAYMRSLLGCRSGIDEATLG